MKKFESLQEKFACRKCCPGQMRIPFANTSEPTDNRSFFPQRPKNIEDYSNFSKKNRHKGSIGDQSWKYQFLTESVLSELKVSLFEP